LFRFHVAVSNGRIVQRVPVLLAGVLTGLLAAQLVTLATWTGATSGPARPRAVEAPAVTPLPSRSVPVPAHPPRPVKAPVARRVLVSLQPFGPGVRTPARAHVIAIPASGPGSAQAVPLTAVRQDQQSVAAGEEVYTKVLAASSHDVSGCGVAGCSQTTVSSTEQGLVLAGLHGEHQRLVTRGGYDSEPVFSPNGRHIMYLSHRLVPYRGTKVEADVIALMTASGRDLGVLVTPKLPGGTVDDPTWSPDSRSIAFQRYLPSASTAGLPVELVVHRLSNRSERVLAHIALHDLAWSPNGRFIVGVVQGQVREDGSGAQAPTGADLWLVSTRDGTRRQLTHLAPSAPIQGRKFCDTFSSVIPALSGPAWSPDGKQIAVASSYGHIADFAQVSDVAVVNVRTGTVRTIYRLPRMSCPAGSIGYTREAGTKTTILGWIP
jgi:hypothetical protein